MSNLFLQSDFNNLIDSNQPDMDNLFQLMNRICINNDLTKNGLQMIGIKTICIKNDLNKNDLQIHDWHKNDLHTRIN